MIAVPWGVCQAWTENKLRAGMCTAALVSAFAHQSDMLHSLPTFQTTEECVSQTGPPSASLWFALLAQVITFVACAVTTWSLVVVCSVECRRFEGRGRGGLVHCLSLVPGVASGQGAHTWGLSRTMLDLCNSFYCGKIHERNLTILTVFEPFFTTVLWH